MWDLLAFYWPLILLIVNTLVALVTSAHAVLHKRDTRATIAWVGLVYLTPLVGSVLYLCFGINRIARRADRLGLEDHRPPELSPRLDAKDLAHAAELIQRHSNFKAVAHLVGRLTGSPVEPGNCVTPLVGGEQAYPAMLAAIDQAQQSVTLGSYIFDNDRAGREFLEALQRAAGRGVEVRVLIDDVGARYSRPTMLRKLRETGVKASAFLPTLVPRMFHYANLRNHRKLMVVDGRLGFTGGMNIREGCRLDWNPPHAVQDLHFQITGPVVAHLQQAMATDWDFASGEQLQGPSWFPELQRTGEVFARGISDGPDEDFEKLVLTIYAAVGAAKKSVDVVTPYFLPEAALITALNVAAMRGVQVRILIPSKNNLRLVQWASTALLPQLLRRDCRVWATPPPFDHTKLIVVDQVWTLLGSSNLDPRSLRLNFEFNVECYDEELAVQLSDLIETKIAASQEITLEQLNARPLWKRLRDGTARLASPYL